MSDIQAHIATRKEIEDDGISYYDNTRLEAYRRCPRKYYFRHIRDWNPELMAKPLGFGLAWHNSMDFVWEFAKTLDRQYLLVGAKDVFWGTWKEHNMPTDDAILMSIYPRTPGRAGEMLEYYIEKYYDWLNEIELLEIESAFIVPIGEDQFENVMYMGRLDKVYRDPRLNNKIVILDHKTTSMMANSWFESFSPNSQVDGYSYAGNMMYGDEFWGIMIDGASVMKNHSKSGPGVDRDLPPGIAFPKVPMQRAFNNLGAWHWEAKRTIMDIENEMATLRDFDIADMHDDFFSCFPKNTTNCFCYGRCIYADVCKMIPNPHKDHPEPPHGFVVDKWDPRNH